MFDIFVDGIEIRQISRKYFRNPVNSNTLDDPNRGENGMHLTVLGTSAEGGDCGQVGRGNKVNIDDC